MEDLNDVEHINYLDHLKDIEHLMYKVITDIYCIFSFDNVVFNTLIITKDSIFTFLLATLLHNNFSKNSTKVTKLAFTHCISILFSLVPGNIEIVERGQESGQISLDNQRQSLTSLLRPSTFTSRRHSSNSRREAFSHEMEAKERRLARISITIVWLFIVCHVWKLIPTIYECFNSENGLEVPEWPFGLVVIEYISHSLIVLNSAVNFLIYVFL